MARPLLTLLLFSFSAAACTDRDAPRPVPVPGREAAAGPARPLSSRETLPPPVPATTVDPDDPAEPGISDLARLARYVFKTMQQHEEVCPFDNPFRDRLHFALAIEVKGGRMTRVGLGHAGLEPGAGGETRTLAEVQWPRELTAYVTCLGPHLGALAMAPAPVDGTYDPVYTFAGRPTGRTAP
jgi:hypothetical protein